MFIRGASLSPHKKRPKDMDELEQLASQWEFLLEPSYERDLVVLQPLVPRLETVQQGIEESLRREPFAMSTRVPGGDHWVRLTEPKPDAPQLRVVFRADSDRPQLIALERVELRRNP